MWDSSRVLKFIMWNATTPCRNAFNNNIVASISNKYESNFKPIHIFLNNILFGEEHF
jgi:hypothetical protein